MSEPILETERLLLRTIGPDDADLQFRTLNTPTIMEHLGGPLTLEAIAEKQRPIEVRVPYLPKGDEGERILALDLLYNPGSRTWQMAEMRFEQIMVEDDG